MSMLLAALLVASAAQSASEPPRQASPALTPDLVASLQTAGDAEISPDGRQVAFLIGGEPSADGVSESKIWMVATVGGGPHRLLEGATGDESEPTWSPDGRRIAYVANRDGAREIYVSDPEGRAERVVGDGTAGATYIAWSPDGRMISFLRRGRAAARKTTSDAPQVSTADTTAMTLWIVDVATGRTREVAHRLRIASRSYTWSPDSRRLAVIVQPPGGVYTSTERETLVVATLDDAPPRVVADLHDRTIWVAWSPDGGTIAWCGREHTPGSGQLMVFDAARSGPDAGRTLAADFPGSLEWIGFRPDGRLAFAALVGLRVGLYSIATDGSSLATVLSPDASRPGSIGSGSWGRFAVSLTADGRHLATVRSGPAEPVNIVTGEWGGPLRRLTDLNPQVGRLALGAVEDFTWTAKDGTEIGGMLIKPVGFQPGRRYPTVVELHGGPRRSWWDTCTLTEGWGQMLATHGYLVLLPNPRGSEGRGATFIRRANRDLGGVDFEDVMAGVEALVARGLADEERLGVAGWSYGGYLTAWTITQTRRFKAAVVGAGITDWISYAGLSGLAMNMATYIWQQPFVAYEEPERLIERSPIHYVRLVRTPTLILHGERDATVPTEQGTELYTALRTLGVPVEHVVYPGEAHVFNRPAHTRDVLDRVLRWFATYLQDPQ